MVKFSIKARMPSPRRANEKRVGGTAIGYQLSAKGASVFRQALRFTVGNADRNRRDGPWRRAAFAVIYSSAIYGRQLYRSGVEKRQRRAAAALAARCFAPPRLRTRQADRAAIARRAPFSRGVAIPAAVSPGEARLDSRPMGREERPAAAALLPADSAGTESPGFPAAGLADGRPGHRPDHRSRKCLTGANRFASNWRT